jgi:MFS transporter, DHA1 family, multidrug resistance protein
MPITRYLDRSTPPHVTTLVIIAGLGAMSLNVFLPSLPGMADYFDADYRVVQLTVSLYLFATAVLQIFIGPISDRYGRRLVLLWTTSLFVLATIGCLLAPTIEIFLFFRMCQAVVAAGFVISRAAVRDMVGPEQSASMIGYVTMGMSLVPMVAPVLGGVLETAFDWRASYLMLLGCGVIILLIVWADMGETAHSRPSSFREQFGQYPELLTARRFWGYCACAGFCAGAFFAFLGGAPFVGTEVFGLSPAVLGFYFGAPAIGYGLGNFFAGRYSVKLGLNRMIMIGCVLCTVGLIFPPILYAFGMTHPAGFFAFVTFVGLGNGIALPNANAGMLSVRPRLAGTASGLGAAIMIGGGSALSVLASSLLVPGSGPYPLQFIMLISSAMSVVAIIYVIRRENQLAQQ